MLRHGLPNIYSFFFSRNSADTLPIMVIDRDECPDIESLGSRLPCNERLSSVGATIFRSATHYIIIPSSIFLKTMEIIVNSGIAASSVLNNFVDGYPEFVKAWRGPIDIVGYGFITAAGVAAVLDVTKSERLQRQRKFWHALTKGLWVADMTLITAAYVMAGIASFNGQETDDVYGTDLQGLLFGYLPALTLGGIHFAMELSSRSARQVFNRDSEFGLTTKTLVASFLWVIETSTWLNITSTITNALGLQRSLTELFLRFGASIALGAGSTFRKTILHKRDKFVDYLAMIAVMLWEANAMRDEFSKQPVFVIVQLIYWLLVSVVTLGIVYKVRDRYVRAGFEEDEHRADENSLAIERAEQSRDLPSPPPDALQQSNKTTISNG
jgi:hypothetical protein